MIKNSKGSLYDSGIFTFKVTLKLELAEVKNVFVFPEAAGQADIT